MATGTSCNFSLPMLDNLWFDEVFGGSRLDRCFCGLQCMYALMAFFLCETVLRDVDRRGAFGHEPAQGFTACS